MICVDQNGQAVEISVADQMWLDDAYFKEKQMRLEPNAPRAALAYRVSTKGQVDHDDIPMQKIDCRKFAQKQGWRVVKEVAEKGVSGSKVSASKRDAIQQLKEEAANGEFDILLVYMFDRLGRIESETPFVLEWFVQHGIQMLNFRPQHLPFPFGFLRTVGRKLLLHDCPIQIVRQFQQGWIPSVQFSGDTCFLKIGAQLLPRVGIPRHIPASHPLSISERNVERRKVIGVNQRLPISIVPLHNQPVTEIGKSVIRTAVIDDASRRNHFGKVGFIAVALPCAIKTEQFILRQFDEFRVKELFHGRFILHICLGADSVNDRPEFFPCHSRIHQINSGVCACSNQVSASSTASV